MDDIEIDEVATPELDDPVLIEGLPGVGHVGKLAAEHLLEEFDGELVRRVYATEFPPQVNVDGDGVAELTCAEFHAVETDGADLLVLTGDHQAGSNTGHYRLTTTFLDVAESFGASRAYALGGVPTGELVEEYTVLGAVSDGDLAAGSRTPASSFDRTSRRAASSASPGSCSGRRPTRLRGGLPDGRDERLPRRPEERPRGLGGPPERCSTSTSTTRPSKTAPRRWRRSSARSRRCRRGPRCRTTTCGTSADSPGDVPPVATGGRPLVPAVINRSPRIVRV